MSRHPVMQPPHALKAMNKIQDRDGGVDAAQPSALRQQVLHQLSAVMCCCCCCCCIFYCQCWQYCWELLALVLLLLLLPA
jgi:hypothetical protein